MENEPHFAAHQNDYYYAHLWNTRIMHHFFPLMHLNQHFPQSGQWKRLLTNAMN